MEKVTYSELIRKVGETVIIFVIIIVFSIYKLFADEFSNEFIFILIGSIIGIIASGRLGAIAKDALQSENFKISKSDSIFTGNVIVTGLSILSFYLFFVKGIYGIYLLFKIFSWYLLFFRLIIVILSYRLVLAISKMHTVFNSIKYNDYTK